MNEWPIGIDVIDQDKVARPVQVVPADLARELYEALKWREERWGHCGCERCTSNRAALARYEREVNPNERTTDH